jgi:hypothetical protein
VIVAADDDAEIETIAAFQTLTLPNLASGQVLISDSTLLGHTGASVDSEVEASTLRVTADVDHDVTTTAVLNGLHLSLFNVAALLPKAITNHSTDASIGSDADLDLSGALTLAANSTTDATAEITSIAMEALSFAIMSPVTDVGGATRAWVDQGALIETNTFGFTAVSDNDADSSIALVSASAVDIDIGSPKASTSHVTEAWVGPRDADALDKAMSGSISVASGGLTISADSTSDASVDELDVELNAVSVSVIDPTVTVKGATRAHLGGNFVFDASFVRTQATSDNAADSDSLQVAISDLDLDFPTTAATVDHATAAYVLASADLENEGGAFAFSAQSTNVASAGGVEISIGTADIDIMKSTASVLGSTSAYLLEGRRPRRQRPQPQRALGQRGDRGHGRRRRQHGERPQDDRQAVHAHTTEAFIGHAADQGRNDALAGSIKVGDADITLSAVSTNEASITDVDVGFATVDVDMIRPEISVGGATRAFLGGEYDIEADDVTATADSTNTASSNAINIEASGLFGLSLPITKIATDHATSAFVAPRALLRMEASDLALSADSTNRAESGAVAVTIGFRRCRQRGEQHAGRRINAGLRRRGRDPHGRHPGRHRPFRQRCDRRRRAGGRQRGRGRADEGRGDHRPRHRGLHRPDVRRSADGGTERQHRDRAERHHPERDLDQRCLGRRHRHRHRGGDDRSDPA